MFVFIIMMLLVVLLRIEQTSISVKKDTKLEQLEPLQIPKPSRRKH